MGAQTVGGRSPFSELSVVEVAQTPAGEQTGKLLADLGAAVLKIEPPEGVASRHTGPWAGGTPDPDRSLEFWVYNTSKSSRVLDVAHDDDRAAFAEVVASADVLVLDDVDQLAGLGWTIEQLREADPALVVVVVTGFGLTGPWSHYRSSDLVALAAGGPLNSCGYDDHSIPPIRPGGNQGFQLGASFAHCGLLLALIQRLRTGRGQLVDVSLHEANAVSGELANPYWFYPKVLVQRQTCRHAQPEPTQTALFETLDGGYVYFTLILAELKAWTNLVAWMSDLGMQADLDDPAYLDLTHRQRNFGHIQQMLEVFFLVQNGVDAYHEGQRRGLPIGQLSALEDLRDDENLADRGFFVELDIDGRTVPFPGMPYLFSAFRTRPGAPPALGRREGGAP